MTRVGQILLLSALLAASTRAADERPRTAPPADFKLTVELFGVSGPAIARAELVIRNGLAYQFLSDVPDEVTIVEPSTARVFLLDLKRKLQTAITARQLDANLIAMRRQALARIEDQIKAGGKANRVAAEISRDLIDPRFETSFDATTHRLRQSNPTVAIDAVGVPEPDPARLATIRACLTTVMKLDAFREPEALPPFPRLQTFDALAAGHGLRPAEVSVLYRMAGPPKKLRWTYQLIPTLTDRETEAIARVETMRSASRYLPFDRYEEAVP